MSNESSVAAERPGAGRFPVLPIAIGMVALAGGALTWMIASPSTPVRTGPPQVGDPAPNFKLESSAGATWQLSDHRGREVLLVFFRTHT